MGKTEKAKEIVTSATDGAKEVVQASGDVVDKVFSNLDTYFNNVATVLTSDAAKEIGRKVVDTGLAVVQVDAIIYVSTWLLSLIALATIAYIGYRILFEKVTPLIGEAKDQATFRITILESKDYYSRTASEDRELAALRRSVSRSGRYVSREDWRQGVGSGVLGISSIVFVLVALLGFNAWKFVAIFQPELYLVKMTIDRLL